jgi:hypothetical protein
VFVRKKHKSTFSVLSTLSIEANKYLLTVFGTTFSTPSKQKLACLEC